MNCAEFAKRIKDGESPSLQMKEHLAKCPSCSQTYSIETLLQTHPSLQVPESAPGEADFLSRMMGLAKTQENSLQRAQEVHEKVQAGDCLFWRGDYDKALFEYEEALMLVRDQQGRAAILNKIARVQTHRHRPKDAIKRLHDALGELNEPAPPSTKELNTAVLVERLLVWWTLFVTWIRGKFPKALKSNIEYGDRSRAAQHLYRELAILAQSQDEKLQQWSHLRELRWALKLQHPLELIVAYGRHAVSLAQQGRRVSASRWIKKISKVNTMNDALTQAVSDFYFGRVAYLKEEWEEARFYLERCIKQCGVSRDDCLREACLQHLIRVYRNDGNYAEAVRVAGKLLFLYHKLGNLPRLSACCRHFALIYSAYGDIRRARAWAFKALDVIEAGKLDTEDHMLSLLRCNVLLADLELRRGQPDSARRYLGEGIRLQRKYQLPSEYFRDGMTLLRQLLDEEKPVQTSKLRTFGRWLAKQWAVMSGDLEKAHSLQKKPRNRSQEHKIPLEIAYLYQEYTGEESQNGLREAIPASTFAASFLQGETVIRPKDQEFQNSADLIASMFPVGAVSSRWGRGSLAKNIQGTTTTQFSNASEAPWGYFFADDIG